MSLPAKLRALVCDPEKGSRRQLCDFLSENTLVEAVTPLDSTSELVDLISAKKINVLFIDPLNLDLVVASKLIFQVREQFPQVIMCLFVRPGEVRRRSTEFYDGEREHFAHYFRLNKDFSGASFDQAALLVVSHCAEAVRRWNSRPGRIELTIPSRAIEPATKPGRYLSAVQQHAREKLGSTVMPRPLPAAGFLSSLPRLKSWTGLISRL